VSERTVKAVQSNKSRGPGVSAYLACAPLTSPRPRSLSKVQGMKTTINEVVLSRVRGKLIEVLANIQDYETRDDKTLKFAEWRAMDTALESAIELLLRVVTR